MCRQLDPLYSVPEKFGKKKRINLKITHLTALTKFFALFLIFKLLIFFNLFNATPTAFKQLVYKNVDSRRSLLLY